MKKLTALELEKVLKDYIFTTVERYFLDTNLRIVPYFKLAGVLRFVVGNVGS